VRLHKHCVRLYEGDYAKLQEMFPELGANTVIRRIIHAYVQKNEADVSNIEVNIESLKLENL
jgi:hypothetical protein